MPADADTYGAVSSLLWREREVLQNLLFKLTEEQLIVASGASRWLPQANAEVEAAAEALRLQEISRAVEVEYLAAKLGMPADATLAEIAQTSEEPWSMLFAEHRTALRDLVLEVQGTAAETSRQLVAAGRAITETLDNLGLSTATYDVRGGRVSRSGGYSGPRLLDEQA